MDLTELSDIDRSAAIITNDIIDSPFVTAAELTAELQQLEVEKIRLRPVITTPNLTEFTLITQQANGGIQAKQPVRESFTLGKYITTKLPTPKPLR